MTTEELVQLLKDEPETVLINVLAEIEYEREHIPKSFNVPISRDGFEEEVEELVGSQETPIVVYSADAECEESTIAAAALAEAGFDEVYDYEGGLREWTESGHPIDHGAA